MSNQQIAIREDSLRELEDSFAIAVRQRELLSEYIRLRLTPGKHFYQVGESKNSLTKEGAELICLPHGYKPAYVVEGGPDQPPENDTPYQITVRCTLMKGDTFQGEGMGSASSHITKRSGERVVRQPDIGLRHNTTLKMAQKSAYIAATLNATAASEFFTQDMEDMEVGSVATEKTAPKDNRFYCAEHNTEWFKRGKMQHYAHPPTGPEGSPWCYMNEARLDAKDNRDQPSVPQPVSQAQQATSEPAAMSFAQLGDLYTWATTIGFPTLKSRMDVSGVAEAIEAKDYTKAAELLTAAKKR